MPVNASKLLSLGAVAMRAERAEQRPQTADVPHALPELGGFLRAFGFLSCGGCTWERAHTTYTEILKTRFALCGAWVPSTLA